MAVCPCGRDRLTDAILAVGGVIHVTGSTVTGRGRRRTAWAWDIRVSQRRSAVAARALSIRTYCRRRGGSSRDRLGLHGKNVDPLKQRRAQAICDLSHCDVHQRVIGDDIGGFLSCAIVRTVPGLGAAIAQLDISNPVRR